MKFQDHAKFIWKNFLIERWPIYSLGTFSVLMTNFMQVLAPKNIGWIVDFMTKKPVPKWLTGHNDQETFLFLFCLLVVSRILLNIFRFLWRVTLGRQTHYACGMLRREVWEHVRYFKKEDLDQKFTKGVLMNAQASDTNSARFVFGFTLVAIADVLFLGVMTFIAMALIHPFMAFASFFVLIFVPFFVKSLSLKEVFQYRVVQDTLSQFNDLSSQAVSTIKLQRLTQTGSFWERRLMEMAERHRVQKLKGVRLNLFYIPVMGAASLISYIILFSLGIYLIFMGRMSAGEFVSMQGLIFLLHDPLMSLGFIVSDWKKGFTALERLSEIYLHEKDENLLIGTESLDRSAECDDVLSVNNVSFAFDESTPLFSKLSFHLKKGDRLGITGAIGAGKSILLSLLSGLNRDFSKGSIELYGRPFSAYSHSALRSHLAFVAQKPFLFAETIRVNVSMNHHLTDEEIWEYLDLAALKEDVLRFPDLLDTQLGEWGINLSGGQKQRLTLARALASQPKVLFLDDCLSAVDTLTEEKILKNLDKYLSDVTIVWVAHRQSTLKYCNQIFELRADMGTISEKL